MIVVSPHELTVQRYGWFGTIFGIVLGIDFRQLMIKFAWRDASMFEICIVVKEEEATKICVT
jgi:hypothetical protein